MFYRVSMLPLVFAWFSSALASDVEMQKYLRPDGELTSRLVLQDSQSGAVGRAGIEIVIEPDGSWTKAQFWGEKRRKELARGRLRHDDVMNLGRVLAEQHVSDLPSEFGTTDATSNPNPRYLTLKFGEQSSDLLLPPQADLEKYLESVSGDEKAKARRFSAAFAQVKKLAEGQ